MSELSKNIYQFDNFVVDLNERQLYRNQAVVPIPPKVFETLAVFVEHSGRLLDKEFLMNVIWPDSFVEESSLTQYIFQLRKILGEDANGIRYIETVPKRGYRFVGKVVSSCTTQPDANQSSENSLLTELPVTASNLSSQSAYVDFATVPTMPNPLRSRWQRHLLLGLLIGFALVLVVVFWNSKAVPIQIAQPLQLTKLTATGKALSSAISPDGKYVAYVLDENGKQSLWMRQLASASTMQLLAKDSVYYQGITFSVDGNYLYFVTYQNPKAIAALYRIPVLGGTPLKILEDVDSAVAVSPDGRQIAFVRNDLTKMQNAIFVANIDGTNEQQIAARRLPYAFSVDGPAWSPDGKMIANAVRGIEAGQPFMTLIGVQLADRQEVKLTDRNWTRLGKVAWQSDGKGLFAIARPKGDPMLTNQLWALSHPLGGVRRITNDVTNYTNFSVSAQTNKIVAIQSTKSANFWIVRDNNFEAATRITSVGIDHNSENMGLSWIAENNLVYGSFANGNTDLWELDLQNGNARQLTLDRREEAQPVVSLDGKFIVYVSDQSGVFHLWRMNRDGSEPQQLTAGEGEYFPSFSADGQWIVYSAVKDGILSVWKIPSIGGTPVRLSNDLSSRPALSPDGKKVAHLRVDPKSFQLKLAVMSIDGEPDPKVVDHPIQDPHILNWSNDGKLITFVETRDGISNVWGVPLDGGNAKQLTNFKSDQIFRFAWSRDGKALACERGFYLNDVVLISNPS